MSSDCRVHVQCVLHTVVLPIDAVTSIFSDALQHEVELGDDIRLDNKAPVLKLFDDTSSQ